MDIKFEGLDELIDSIEDLGDINRFRKPMSDCVASVEASAKDTYVPVDTGDLKRSIKSKVEVGVNEIVGTVYATESYAPYIEYGSGQWAEEGGSSGWWVYVKGEGAKKGKKPAKHYATREEAKQVCAILRKKGLEAYYTNGHQAANGGRGFLRPALMDNKEKITRILRRALKNG